MPLIGKIWGTTEAVLINDFVVVHRLSILPHRECSLHCHNFKNNAFLVVKGELTIEVHKHAYDLVDKTRIGPGECTTVKPGEFHKFITGAEAVEAFEIYYPEPLSEDIVRKTVGGIAAPEAA